MTLAELDYSRYTRNNQKIKEQIQKLLQQDQSEPNKDYLKYLEFECSCLIDLNISKISEDQIRNLFEQIDKHLQQYNSQSLVQMDGLCFKIYLCQYMFKFEKSDIELNIQNCLYKLPSIKNLMKRELLTSIEQTPFRVKNFQEIYLKRILNPDFHIETQDYFQEIIDWLDFFAEIQNIHQKSFYQTFKGFEKVDKNLILICINKLIQVQNKISHISNIEAVIRVLQFFQKEYRNLYGIDMVITLLYNICKNILPLQGSTELEQGSLQKIIQNEINTGLFQYFQIQLKVSSWDHILLACLGFIQIQIDKKVEKYMNKNADPSKKQNTNKQLLNYREISNIPSEVYDSLYLFTCINYTQIRNKIKKTMRSILSYRVPSLVNLLSLKIKREDFAFNFMEFMMSSPFDDNILGMKMSVQLYLREEYSKLYQLIQSLTQSEQLPSHPAFPLLLSLSSIFTGLNLGKNEEGLSLAKLNLNNFLESGSESSRKIFLQETLLANVGFSYYNIFRNAQYEQDKNVYLSKAIEYLEKSYSKNNKNYLVCQALAKAYAHSLNMDKALEYALQSCALNKSSHYAFILLALIYSAKGELKKCQLLISSLLKENQNEPILYILMAFIEAEKLLIAEENLPDYKVSHHFGSGIKDFLKSESQKSKQFKQIILYMVNACQVILKKELSKEFDPEFCKKNLIPLKDQHSQEIPPRVYLDYKNTLNYFIDILFHLEYYDCIEDMTALLNDGNKKNFIESEYYLALLSEKKEQDEIAMQKYEEILKTDFYHLKSMQNLALLYLKNINTDSRRVDRAVELLIAGSKFKESSEICYGFGQIHQLQGNLQKSNHYLLKALEKNKKQPICIYDIIPDLLFIV
ncbi:hypothetical protein ABPG74_018538 [Tetrahymena malaccensis]